MATKSVVVMVGQMMGNAGVDVPAAPDNTILEWWVARNQAWDLSWHARNGFLATLTAAPYPVPVTLNHVGTSFTVTGGTAGSPTQLTLSGVHNRGTGRDILVRISGNTGSTPDINGEHLCTITAVDGISIPVATSVVGVNGTVKMASLDIYDSEITSHTDQTFGGRFNQPTGWPSTSLGDALGQGFSFDFGFMPRLQEDADPLQVALIKYATGSQALRARGAGTSFSVASITSANPAVLTLTGSTLISGVVGKPRDSYAAYERCSIVIEGATGTPNINGHWTGKVLTDTTIELVHRSQIATTADRDNSGGGASVTSATCQLRSMRMLPEFTGELEQDLQEVVGASFDQIEDNGDTPQIEFVLACFGYNTIATARVTVPNSTTRVISSVSGQRVTLGTAHGATEPPSSASSRIVAKITGATGYTPNINGIWEVKIIDSTKFDLPFPVTVVGTGGVARVEDPLYFFEEDLTTFTDDIEAKIAAMTGVGGTTPRMLMIPPWPNLNPTWQVAEGYAGKSVGVGIVANAVRAVAVLGSNRYECPLEGLPYNSSVLSNPSGGIFPSVEGIKEGGERIFRVYQEAKASHATTEDNALLFGLVGDSRAVGVINQISYIFGGDNRTDGSWGAVPQDREIWHWTAAAFQDWTTAFGTINSNTHPTRNTGTQLQAVGIEAMMLEALKQRYARKVRMLKLGVNGATLTTNTGGAAIWDMDDGDVWPDYIAGRDSVTAAMNAQGLLPVWGGIFVVLGLNDAIQANMSQEDLSVFRARAEAFIDDLRAAFPTPDGYILPIVWAKELVHDDMSPDLVAEVQAVNSALTALNRPNIALVDPANLVCGVRQNTDKLHYSLEGQNELGEQMVYQGMAAVDDRCIGGDAAGSSPSSSVSGSNTFTVVTP